MSETPSIVDLLGKRVLLRTKESFSRMEVEEYRIEEVSPSGVWVKLMRMQGGFKFWRPVTDCALIEVLHPLRPEKPPRPDKAPQ